MRHHLIAAAMEDYEEGVALKDYKEKHDELLKGIDDYIGAEPQVGNLLEMHDAVTEVMEKTAAMEGLNPSQFRLVRTSVRGIVQVKRLSTTAFESFDRVDDKKRLQIALEEQKGFLAKIWDAIKAFVKGVINFIKKLLGIKTDEDKKKEADTIVATSATRAKSMDNFNKALDGWAKQINDDRAAAASKFKSQFAEAKKATAGTTTQSVKVKDKPLKEWLRERKGEATDAVVKDKSAPAGAQPSKVDIELSAEIKEELINLCRGKEVLISFSDLALIAPYSPSLSAKDGVTLGTEEIKEFQSVTGQALAYVANFHSTHVMPAVKTMVEDLTSYPQFVEMVLNSIHMDTAEQSAKDEGFDRFGPDSPMGKYLNDGKRFKGHSTIFSTTFFAGYQKDEDDFPPTLTMLSQARNDGPKQVSVSGEFRSIQHNIASVFMHFHTHIGASKKNIAQIEALLKRVDIDRIERASNDKIAAYEEKTGKQVPAAIRNQVRMLFKMLTRATRSVISNHAVMVQLQEQYINVLKQFSANADGIEVAHLSAMDARAFHDALKDDNVKSVTV